MLTIPPTKYPRRHGRYKPRATMQAPPGPLTLVAASYNKDELTVTLTFGRAIDISGIVVAEIAVDDDLYTGSHLIGSGLAELLGPAVVRVALMEIDGTMYPEIHLTASAGNGIVAVNDGAEWAGVSVLALPFP